MTIALRLRIFAAVILALVLSGSGISPARAAEDMGSDMDMSKQKDDMKMPQEMPQEMPMKMMAPADAPVIPPVTGYSEGERILFLHTEASDQEITQLLTDMMGSPVVYVPSLAQAPAEMLATVFVFTNGVKPDGAMGPFEFQPDVFDFPPHQPGYRPLRKIVLVSWNDSAAPRILTSADDVARAAADDQISLQETNIVVNMPMLTWPGGQR